MHRYRQDVVDRLVWLNKLDRHSAFYLGMYARGLAGSIGKRTARRLGGILTIAGELLASPAAPDPVIVLPTSVTIDGTNLTTATVASRNLTTLTLDTDNRTTAGVLDDSI